jgi:hypothetical protein
MADIQYKVCGDSPSFVARLYKNSDRSNIVCEKFFDYSGTSSSYGVNDYTINFSNLLELTNYYVTICDSIGNLATGNTTTLQNLTPSGSGGGSLPIKTITMGGVVNSTPTTSSVSSCGNLNHIIASPALSQSDVLNITFKSTIINSSSNCFLINNSVSLFRRPNGGSVYSPLISIVNTNIPYDECIVTANFNYGDSICYTMNTVGFESTTNASGSAKLEITLLSDEEGFIPQLGNPISLTTAVNIIPTPPPPPTETTIYFEPISVSSTAYNCDIYSKLCTSPPLTNTDSFKLYYTDSAALSTATELPQELSSCSYAKSSPLPVKINLASVYLEQNLVGSDSCNKNSFITINAANIDCYTFHATANSGASNLSEEHFVTATSLITNVESISGTYVLGNCRSISATVGQ